MDSAGGGGVTTRLVCPHKALDFFDFSEKTLNRCRDIESRHVRFLFTSLAEHPLEFDKSPSARKRTGSDQMRAAAEPREKRLSTERHRSPPEVLTTGDGDAGDVVSSALIITNLIGTIRCEHCELSTASITGLMYRIAVRRPEFPTPVVIARPQFTVNHNFRLFRHSGRAES